MGSCFSSDFEAYADLDFAISLGHCTKTVELRLRRIEDINAVLPISKVTALKLARHKRRSSIVNLLLARGARGWPNSNAAGAPQLRACEHDLQDVSRPSVDRGRNRTASSPNGSTYMPMASTNRHLAVLSYLLKQDSCPIDSIEVDGQPLLHYALLTNDPSLISEVISKGVDINEKNEDGETPVFVATKNSSVNCLRVLLDAEADPNICAKEGDFAIHEAVNQGCTKTMKMLLKHGADRTKTGKDGLTPIRRALNFTPSNPSIVNSLLNDYLMVHTREKATLERRRGEEEMNKLGHQVKECITCPITLEVMRDPVIAADGHTYERKAIEQWLRQKRESPVTRQPLPSSTLTPSLSIRHLIDQYLTISERQ